jgi:hypothetical protein
MYGIGLTLPFPVWNQNGYGKEGALKIQKANAISFENTKQEVSIESERLVNLYSKYKELLSQAPTQSEMELKHSRIDAQLIKGLVSSALVIEAHRSLLDVLKSRHETETNALETLWNIYRIEGSLQEITL